MGRVMDFILFFFFSFSKFLFCQKKYPSFFKISLTFSSTEFQLLYTNVHIIHWLLSYFPCGIK